MKLIKTIFASAALIACCFSAQAFDWESLKKAVSNVAGGNETVSSIVDNVLKTDKLEVSDLEGTWKSSGPSISFKSESLLEQAGGVAAAATIESKLEPYYKKAGLENATFTFTSDGNLTITIKNGKTISATVTKGEEDGTFIFNFNKANSSSKIGKFTAYVSKGTSLSIMFDATKLVSLVNTISKYAKSSTITSAATLLNSYDGIYAGFKFDKQ